MQNSTPYFFTIVNFNLILYNINMKSLVVNEKYNEKNLNRFLLDNFNNLTLNDLYKALRKKDIKVNGNRINKNITIYTGDVIDVYISDDILYSNKEYNLDIVYEDDMILVINKPSGIEVTGNNSLCTMLLNKYGNSIYPCHRLDRNTSGLVLFAKTEESLSILLEKFKNGEIQKHYICHVYGIPKHKKNILTSYLFKDAKKSMVYISDVPKKGYRKIITEYKVLEKFNDNTCILDINLHTGRTHQIRAHLAHIGCPIIGDGKYGNNEINKAFHSKTQKLCSYKMKFCFKQDSGILNYLNYKEFNIERPF